MKGRLCGILGIKTEKDFRAISKKIGISTERLKYFNNNEIFPSGSDLQKILEYANVNEIELKLTLGLVDREILSKIANHAKEISSILDLPKASQSKKPKMVFSTDLGELYEGDCLSLLKSLDDSSVDVVFADPPFNLDKFYLSGMDDNLNQSEYLNWCEQWLTESVRVLKDGGSLFLWNLPKWNSYLSNFLNSKLLFRHWIAVDIKFSLPIQGKLYPSHYSLMYYCKGPKPNTFKPDRFSMDVCKICFGDIKDYGGYKDKMNPKGINATDVWLDIPPVRHKKYKKRIEANELSIKLLDRIIEMSSKPGDIIFDPFGGSGTTYVVAEMKKRKWIGVELGPTEGIIGRFHLIHEELDYLNQFRENYNTLFPSRIKAKRKKLGLWTDDTFHSFNGTQLELVGA